MLAKYIYCLTKLKFYVQVNPTYICEIEIQHVHRPPSTFFCGSMALWPQAAYYKLDFALIC